MIDTPNRPPLWQVLMNAGDPPCTMQEMTAAEIRALRDWLVPDEPEPRIYEHCDREDLVTWHRWDQCQELRDLLTDEADRAERGEHG